MSEKEPRLKTEKERFEKSSQGNETEILGTQITEEKRTEIKNKDEKAIAEAREQLGKVFSGEENSTESKEEKSEYNPIISVRRDFDKEWIFKDEETGEAKIDNADLISIMDFYAKEVKNGTLLDLGAGPTHLHYMSAIEEKLTHITALDLSKKNLQVVRELLDSVAPNSKGKEREYISDKDVELLKIVAESRERIKHRKNPKEGTEILQSICEKSKEKEEYDFIIGDMHDLSTLENRKFDNIMIGFALYSNNEGETLKLLMEAKEHLNPGGKLIIADFEWFPPEIVKGQKEYEEDEEVMKRYPNFVSYYSLEMLKNSLIKAGFSEDKIKTSSKPSETEEYEGKKLKYLFVSAEKE